MPPIAATIQSNQLLVMKVELIWRLKARRCTTFIKVNNGTATNTKAHAIPTAAKNGESGRRNPKNGYPKNSPKIVEQNAITNAMVITNPSRNSNGFPILLISPMMPLTSPPKI